MSQLEFNRRVLELKAEKQKEYTELFQAQLIQVIEEMHKELSARYPDRDNEEAVFKAVEEVDQAAKSMAEVAANFSVMVGSIFASEHAKQHFTSVQA